MEHTSPLPHVSDETREISLRLEKHDDIFSDFDIRPYSKRALSIDFLDEIKRATNDKTTQGIELLLFVPEKERSEAHEATIRERLSAHFKRHHQLLVKEKRKVTQGGVLMVVLGMLSMIAATMIHFKNSEGSVVTSFLLVFLEPAAWFLLWEGMDQIVFESKHINPELNFYRKMASAHAHVHFKSY